jgi:hypothetical protein
MFNAALLFCDEQLAFRMNKNMTMPKIGYFEWQSIYS